MEQIYHFSDQLGSVDCIPCLGENHSGRYSRDHIPTRSAIESSVSREPHGRGDVSGM